LLLEYLRTITLYVDTKDRNLVSTDLRERLGWVEQRLLALKRETEARGASDTTRKEPPSGAFASRVDSTDYVAFEDRFRGSEEEVQARAEEYLPLLASSTDVVDVGCGRGELLRLLRAHGIAARGVDANHAMVEVCRSHGVDVDEGDALAYLERQPDGTIGALTAIQVVEHFEPSYLMRFLQTANQKMRPGAPLVLETINPACWAAFFDAYIRDITHARPLHPETLKFHVEASGFHSADVRFRHPIREADRLPGVAVLEPAGAGGLGELAAALNAQAGRLNARLFSFTDYAIIARR
jgi:O-antigen chain-terminating methyltransferase